MPKLKRIRHEHFCRRYIANGGNGREAYSYIAQHYPIRKSYQSTMSCEAQMAHLLLKRPEINERLNEMRATMAKKADITMEKILSDYQEALNIARAQAKAGDMVTAATAQAKLVGLLRDRVETGNVGDFDGLESLDEIIETVRASAGTEAADALMAALGIQSSPEVTQANAEPPNEELAKAIPPSDAVN